jgi:hypothetical protein
VQVAVHPGIVVLVPELVGEAGDGPQGRAVQGLEGIIQAGPVPQDGHRLPVVLADEHRQAVRRQEQGGRDRHQDEEEQPDQDVAQHRSVPPVRFGRARDHAHPPQVVQGEDQEGPEQPPLVGAVRLVPAVRPQQAGRLVLP